MKKISTSIILITIICILISSGLIFTCNIILSLNRINDDNNKYLNVVSEKYAEKIDANFEKYQTISYVMADYMKANYDYSKIKDLEYNEKVFNEFKSYVLSVNKEYPELLSAYVYLNPEITNDTTIAWSTKQELISIDDSTAKNSINSMLFYVQQYFYNNDEGHWIDPYNNNVINEKCMSFIVPVYSEDGNLIGGAGIDFKFEDFVDIVKSIKLYDTGKGFLLDKANRFIADDKYAVEDNLETVGYTNLQEAIKSEKQNIVIENIDGNDCYMTYVKLSNGYILCVSVPKSEVHAGINETIKISIGILGTAIVISFAVACIISKRISTPIENVSKDLEIMKDGDFTGKKHVSYINVKNEIGMLARALDSVENSIKNIVDNISGAAETLRDFTGEYNKSFVNARSSMENINCAVSEIAGSITSQAEESQKANNNIIDMGKSIDNTTASIKKLSESYDKMKACNCSVNNTLNDLTRMSEKTKEAISIVNIQTSATHDSVEQIRKASKLISDIADQTNLLSLNASIEAARAGEAGKGFSVVAEEIQVLADQSQKSAEKINKIIEELINNSNISLKTMDELDNVITNENEKMNDTKHMFNDLNSEIDVITAQVSNILKDIDNLSKLKGDALMNIDDLSATAQENAARTEETSALMNEVTSIIQGCMQATNDLLELSEMLIHNTNKFKV